MSGQNSAKTKHRVAELPQNKATFFTITPNAAALKALAAELGILDLRKLHFDGKITARGKKDWEVTGTLGATIVQSCVVTLNPVTTRIDNPVNRLFAEQVEALSEEEYEITDDDASDPLGDGIDLEAVMFEELGLGLPLYPRAENAEAAKTTFAEPGITPMQDEDARPFAGLAGLRDQLAKKDDN